MLERTKPTRPSTACHWLTPSSWIWLRPPSFPMTATRYRAFGRIDGLGYCLVFSHRAEKVRVISFRRCHEREMARYDR